MSEDKQSAENNSNQKEQPQDTKLTDAWDKSQKQLIDQHKDKQGAFKSMADESGYIGENNFNIGGEQKSEIFKKFDADHDGKISQQEWNQGWNNLDVQVLETQHKVQIAQQKLQILDALEAKPEPGLSLIQKPTHNHYNSLVQNFKSTSTLNDLTDFLNKKSPFQNTEDSAIENYIDYKRDSNNRPLDSLLQQFKTPNKVDFFTETGSAQNSGQYQGNNNKPTSKFGYVQGSASPGFNPNKLKPDNSINSRVHQNMNVNIELKDHCKTNKRKEELSQFMGKMGLGNNDIPARATISAEQPNQNVFERMRFFVNNIGSSNLNKSTTQQTGLNELLVDKQFNTSTFKQQLKLHRKDRNDFGDQQVKYTKPLNQLDNPLLQDQSLKSFHLKLLHQQQASNKFARN